MTPVFFGLEMIGRTIFTKLWTFWEISPKQIEENQRQSQIIAGERLPSWSLSLKTKTISIIFTTVNDSPNLTYFFLMALSDLEKRKHEKVSGKTKLNVGARANIEQKPCEASSNFLEKVLRWKCRKRSLKFFFFFATFVIKYFFINNCLHW